MAVGDKYIIELEEVYHGENHPNSLELYRVKGFNTLVFDHYGLNRLERLDEHDDALITKLAKNYYTKDDFERESKDAYERGYADCMAENDFDKPCASCPDSRKHGKWKREKILAWLKKECES